MLRKAYPTDVSDEEWDFALSSQSHHDLREVLNALH